MKLTLRQILLILRLRWWVILGILAIVVGAGAAVTLRMEKQYTAETSVLLDVRTDPLVATLAPNMASSSFIATQIEIIRSKRLASRVVNALRLLSNASAVEQWREATQGRVPLDAYFGELLQRGLLVEPVPGSALMNIRFTGNDPKFAATVANAFAQAYIDLSVELRVGPAKEYASFFDERLKTLREDLEGAQGRLSAFQQRRGIIVSNERVDQETSRLNSLENALATALADSADTSSRQRNAGTETSFDVSQSTAVQSLRSELARAETRLSEVSATFGSNHPLRIELETRIAELKQQIASEIRRVTGTTTSINRIASQRVSELRSMVDAQKRTVLNLRAQRDEAGTLLREVEAAQRAFDAVAQRRAQLANETQAEQAQARVLSAATDPLTHSRPNILKYMVAALFLGLVAGLAGAFVLELLDRRVRSAEDLENLEGVPVLGVMSSSRGKPTFSPRLAFKRRPGLATPPRLTMDEAPQ